MFHYSTNSAQRSIFLLFFFNTLTLRLSSHHIVHFVSEAQFQETQYSNLYTYYFLV